MKLILLTIAVILPLTAGWERKVLTAKGDRIDTPQHHPLSYFTRYPLLRDEDGFCFVCSPGKRLLLARQKKVRTEVRVIGVIRGFSIYDVLYFFDGEKRPGWKSILVRT